MPPFFMPKYSFLLLFFVFSCKPKYDLPKEQVAKTLMGMASEHPEKRVKIETRMGDVLLELFDETPLHRISFIRLVKMGYFQDRYFYRNIYDSGMQGGGGYEDRLSYLIPAEYLPHLKPVRGSIAMARYDEGNPEKSSSPTEFFIITNTEEAKAYEGNYVVFGRVVSGLSVMDRIKQARSFDEKPVVPVKFRMEVLP